MEKYIVTDGEQFYKIPDMKSFLMNATKDQIKSVYYSTKYDLVLNNMLTELVEAELLEETGGGVYPFEDLEYTLDVIRNSGEIPVSEFDEIDLEIEESFEKQNTNE